MWGRLGDMGGMASTYNTYLYENVTITTYNEYIKRKHFKWKKKKSIKYLVTTFQKINVLLENSVPSHSELKQPTVNC